LGDRARSNIAGAKRETIVKSGIVPDLSRYLSLRPGILAVLLLCLTFCRADESALPLRTAAEVRALPLAATEAHPQVRLRGVLTFSWHTEQTEITLQDATGGVWLPAMKLPADCRVGTEVEVVGRVEQSGFGPVVRTESIRALQPGALPAPKSAVYEDLLAADWNALRVELTGVVRGQRVNPEIGLGWLALELASGGGRVTVNVTHEITGHPELVDARVRVRGVCLHGMDSQHHTFLPMINAHSLQDIEVIEPGTANPFNLPPLPLQQLMRTAGPAGPGHRVRVTGAVTILRPGGSFFLQDETRGVQIFLREAAQPEIGEVIDAVGFPEPGAYSPVLRDADWRPSGARQVPPALEVHAAEAVKFDGRLLKVRGLLNSVESSSDGTLLMLDDSERHFVARVPGRAPDDWTPGSRLAITGVCAVDVGNWESLVTYRQPQGFTLLVRHAPDVVREKAAPWWTPVRIAWMLAVMGAGLFGLLGAVWWRGHRRLHEVARTREAARVQFQAVLGERTRLAREIHDTLAQGFAGISVQLEVLNDQLAATAAPGTMCHLDLARSLVRESLAESRRTVWNLRAQSLEECGLTGALEKLGQQLTGGRPLELKLTIDGSPRPLPPDVENNLLRIAQEALTNAVNHASARILHVTLEFLEHGVRLTVRDDGCGFDVNAPAPAARTSGFGLKGIRERAAAMSAELHIISEPGAGTAVAITIPYV
jgi:signal transduction histidine kinase